MFVGAKHCSLGLRWGVADLLHQILRNTFKNGKWWVDHGHARFVVEVKDKKIPGALVTV